MKMAIFFTEGRWFHVVFEKNKNFFIHFFSRIFVPFKVKKKVIFFFDVNLFTFGPRLKTEGIYKITSVCPFVRPFVGLSRIHSETAPTIFLIFSWCRAQIGVKNIPSGFFIFSLIFVKNAKNTRKRPKNEVFAIFLKNDAYDFPKILPKKTNNCV